jgi:hypothetical protein
MISEVWRELKHVARELGSLMATLLPWLPAVGLATFGLEHFGAPAAGVIVFIAPYYRKLLRGGRAPHVLVWLLIASTAMVVKYLAADWQSWLVSIVLILGSLVVSYLL